jgi:hypothetical protein
LVQASADNADARRKIPQKKCLIIFWGEEMMWHKISLFISKRKLTNLKTYPGKNNESFFDSDPVWKDLFARLSTVTNIGS